MLEKLILEITLLVLNGQDMKISFDCALGRKYFYIWNFGYSATQINSQMVLNEENLILAIGEVKAFLGEK